MLLILLATSRLCIVDWWIHNTLHNKPSQFNWKTGFNRMNINQIDPIFFLPIILESIPTSSDNSFPSSSRSSMSLLHRVGKRKTKSKTVSLVSKGTDRISGLSDDLLVKIISFLPTEVAVSTSILSKRWEFIWLWLPKLKFRYGYNNKSLPCFLDRNLPLHRAPVIESFHLNGDYIRFKPEDIKLWVVLALSHRLRKLKITNYRSKNPDILPSNLYNCNSLVTLKLSGDIRLDVPRTRMVSLPSLKTLHLCYDKYLDGASLQRLLSLCPVLEELLLNCKVDDYTDNMGWITITVPSLRSLDFYVGGASYDLFDGLVIDTPSLKCMTIENYNEDGHPCLVESYMPNLEEAYIDVRHPDIESLIGGITSVKRLTICLGAIVYKGSFVFNQLEHVHICLCSIELSNLLVRLLEDSPNLRVLDIFELDHGDSYFGWSAGPESIMPLLQKYVGRPQKRDLEVNVFGEPLLIENCNNNRS